MQCDLYKTAAMVYRLVNQLDFVHVIAELVGMG